jgi:hypothetical protein
MSKQPEWKLEQTKAYIEYLKHLTTLSTGSILLIATFLEKLFSRPLWKTAVVISIAGFIISVLASITVYSIILENEFDPDYHLSLSWTSLLYLVGLLVVWGGFLIGVISLAAFTIRNLI